MTAGARKAIRQLTAGMTVGHVNPELASWEGVITADDRGQWWTMRRGGDVRVHWTAGTDGRGQPMAGSTDWIDATALTIKGECPSCGRPAHRVLPGPAYHPDPGWNHDQLTDAYRCWASDPAAPPAHPDSAAILAALPLRPRRGLYIAPQPDSKGALTILERPEDQGEETGEAIIGLAVHDETGWYLACTGCQAEIEGGEGGMC